MLIIFQHRSLHESFCIIAIITIIFMYNFHTSSSLLPRRNLVFDRRCNRSHRVPLCNNFQSRAHVPRAAMAALAPLSSSSSSDCRNTQKITTCLHNNNNNNNNNRRMAIKRSTASSTTTQLQMMCQTHGRLDQQRDKRRLYGTGKSRCLSSNTSTLNLAGFALWSSSAEEESTSPINESGQEEDSSLLSPSAAASASPRYILRVKGLPTKNDGSAIGFYCFKPGTPNAEHLGGSAFYETSRNAFESYYSGIISSLDYIHRTHPLIKSVTVQCDHETVIHQLNGKYEIQRETLRLLYWKVMEMKERMFDDVRFEYIKKHQNKEAEDLASKAMGSKSLMSYHFDMIDPMGPPGTTTTTAAKSDANNHDSSAFSESTTKAEASNPTSHSGPQTSTEDAPVAKEPIHAPSDENSAAVMDIFEMHGDATPSPSISFPNGPSIYPEHTYILEFDGGARGNPSTLAGTGAVLYDTGPSGQEKEEVWAGWKYLGDSVTTNNQAEYAALIMGLKAALARGIKKIAALGDSNLVINHITGDYRVRDKKLMPMWEETKQLLEQFDSYEMRHIRRHLNGRADGLANLAMDLRESGSSD